MKQEILVGDRIILPSVKVRHSKFIGAFELADVEISFRNNTEMNFMIQQLLYGNEFNNL